MIHVESTDCWCEPQVLFAGPPGLEELGRVIVHHPEEWRQFTAFRRDGWPLCPGCGEDELWTPWTPPTDPYFPHGQQLATLDDYVSHKLRCYVCGWISA